VSDIDTRVVDSLKALDPNRPIREADMEEPLFDQLVGACDCPFDINCEVDG
jgi:hypothetical protein